MLVTEIVGLTRPNIRISAIRRRFDGKIQGVPIRLILFAGSRAIRVSRHCDPWWLDPRPADDQHRAAFGGRIELPAARASDRSQHGGDE